MASRTDSHTISHAENIFSGDAYVPGANDSGRGIPRVGVVVADFGTPVILDTDGICAAQAVAGAGALTIDGALAAAGSASLDVARTLQAVSANAGDTSQVLTVTGTDMYGAAVVEDITLNGTTPVFGAKAFKTVTSVVASAATAGDVTVGTSDALGLPYAIADAGDAFLANEAGANATIGPIVGADTTSPATATTGEVRGTYNPTVVLDGSTSVKLYYFPAGRKTVSAYGVPQYSA